MRQQPQRIVEAAIIEKIGPIRADQLLTMSDDSWGLLRDRITDRRNGSDGLRAQCMWCESDVYIRTTRFKGISRPLFQHYAGADTTCPWYQGRNTKPDDARAAQYQGRQESPFHRLMCEQIANLASLDARYTSHTVGEYRSPTESEHGRFPDVLVKWENFGQFAFEFQMSGTFQTEVSARCKHYEREDVPLLWILFGLDTAADLSQSFVDVIRRHRGNAFAIDPAAVAASHELKTLVLSCYLRNASGGLDAPKLVRFDELTVPRSRLPYHEDRIIGPRLAEIEQLRRPWFSALTNWTDNFLPLRSLERPQSLLAAAAFSMVATANGRPTNYVDKQPNLSAMLNTYLSTKVFSRYTDLLERLIVNIAIGGSLRSSVGQHLRDYRSDDQVGPESPEWQHLKSLLPEALDPLFREELIYLDALPDWARMNE